VLVQIRLNEFGERQPARDPPLASKPLQLMLERIASVLLRREPATLNALRIATTCPVAERPQPLAVGSACG
jgi:hypothetical protein